MYRHWNMTKILFFHRGCQECDRPIRLVTYEVIETFCWRLTKFLSKYCAPRYALSFKCFLLNNVAQTCSWWCNFLLLYENVYVKRITEKSAVSPQITTHFYFFRFYTKWMACMFIFFIFFLYYQCKRTRVGCTLLDMKSMKYFLQESQHCAL